jgi:streptogramin lyase
LYGKGFGTDADAVEVKFNTKIVPVILCKDTEILVFAPEEFPGNDCEIAVKKNDIIVQFAGKFTCHAFILESFKPLVGHEGTPVTLTGTNFGTDPNIITVMFNDKPVEIVSCSDREIVVYAPDELDEVCTEKKKKEKSPFKSFAETFRFFSDFELDYFEPAEGGVGALITLYGSGFGTKMNDIQVTIDSKPVTALHFHTDRIIVQIPDQASAQSVISVTKVNKTVEYVGRFAYYSGLHLKSFYPERGEAKTQVTLKGFNMGTDPAAVTVKFNNEVAKLTGCFNDSVHVLLPKAPAGTAQYTVSVTKGGSAQTYANSFNYERMKISTVVGISGSTANLGGAFGVARFRDPQFLTISADGNLLILTVNNQEEGNGQIARIDLANRNVRFLGTDVTNATGKEPKAPCTLPDGKILIPANGDAGWTEAYWEYDPVSDFFRQREVLKTTPTFALQLFKHSFAYCPHDGKVYYRSNRNGAIIRFDPETRIGQYATAEVGNARLWMSHTTSDGAPDANSTGANPPANGGFPLPGGGNPDGYIVFDPNDPKMMWVALAGRHLMARMDITTGAWRYFGDGAQGSPNGPLSSTRFSDPRQMAFDNDGNLWFADAGGHCIRKIDLKTETVTNVVGSTANVTGSSPNGTAADNNARLNSPRGIAFDKEYGILYYVEFGTKLVRKISIE